MDKPFLRAFTDETASPPPFWVMRQAGRYLPEYRRVRESAGGFLNLCYNPEMAVEVALQPLRRYSMDAAILFSDILVIPDGLGQPVSFREGEGPALTPLKTEAEITALNLDRMRAHLAPVYETVRLLKAGIPEETALIGFAGAPWTVATYMIEGGGGKDYPLAKRWAFGDGPMAPLMAILTEATSRHLLAQIDAGAEAVQVFDTWAGVLPEQEFQRWVIEPTRLIVDRIHREKPGVPVIGFPRGAGVLYERFVQETGVDGVSIDGSVPLAWAAERLQPLCTVQGNLDPMLLVMGGQPMLDRIDTILKTLGRKKFIFNLGHGIVPQTPPENVSDLAKRVRAYKI